MSEFVKAFFFFFFWVQVTNRKGTQDAEGRAASSLYSLECELCEAINRRLIAGVKTKELYNSVALWETGSRLSGKSVDIHFTVNNICAQIRAKINLLRRRQ